MINDSLNEEVYEERQSELNQDLENEICENIEVEALENNNINIEKNEYITFNLRGKYYTLSIEELSNFPNCLLSKMISSDWNKNKITMFNIDRNNKYFDLIVFYIRNRELPCNKFGESSLEKSEVKEFEIEVDYFNIPELSNYLLMDNQARDFQISQTSLNIEIYNSPSRSEIVNILCHTRGKCCASGT